MPIVNIQRVKPQIKALEAHINNADTFINSLHSLLRMYSAEKKMNSFSFDTSKTPSFQIPKIIFSEIDSSLKKIAKIYPQQAIQIAEKLWNDEFLEPKIFAITILSGLPTTYQEDVLNFFEDWVNSKIDDELFKELISVISAKLNKTNNQRWLQFIGNWVMSDVLDVRKNGLLALGELVIHKSFQDFPKVFSLITPIFSQPDLFVQKDLLAFTEILAKRTQPETASFLIMLIEVYPSKDVFSFVRKCLAFFDDFFQDEIKRALRK